MNRILRVQLRRKSLYENLDISPSASTEEVLSKIARLSKDGGIVDEQMARQIARFRKSRFDYDVIVALEEKEAKLHGREPLPPFINPDTERRIASMKISEERKTSLRQLTAHIGFRFGTFLAIMIVYIVVCRT